MSESIEHGAAVVDNSAAAPLHPCADTTPHPPHIVFPIGGFPAAGVDCYGVTDIGPWLTGPLKAERKRVNGRNKGLTAERHLANWLVGQGWPDARRSVSTGWKTKDRHHQDQGDITGTPRLCFQLKNLASDLVPGVGLDQMWREVREQAGPDRLPLLVEKRTGKASPGEWFLWLRLADLAELTTGMPAALITRANNLVRTTLGYHAADLLDYSRSGKD